MEILHWKVTDVMPETRDTITYALKTTDGRTVFYEAGQFLTFLFDHHGQELRRSYSMSTTPGVDQQLAITVKRKVNGAISRLIQQKWQVGTLVDTIEATGMFRIETQTAIPRTFFFVAAGSGIVPVFSLLKKILHFEPQSRAILIDQNFDEENIIFNGALHHLENEFGDRFIRINLLSRPRDPHVSPRRLNNALLEYLILANLGTATPANTFFYTCGPLLFMKMVEFTVRVMGFDADRLRKENFTIETAPAPRLSLDTIPRNVTVHYGKDTYGFTATYPRSILDAALERGIKLPYSCRAGRCSSCVAKCVSGSVVMSINEVLTEKDLQDGLVLTCVGFAKTDVELQF